MINEMRKMALERRVQLQQRNSPQFNLLSDLITGNPSGGNRLWQNPHEIRAAFDTMRSDQQEKFRGLLEERKKTMNTLIEGDVGSAQLHKKTLKDIEFVEACIDQASSEG